MYSLDVLMKPADHGYIECNFCNGLGSLDCVQSKHIICSVCDGSGILKIKSQPVFKKSIDNLSSLSKINNYFKQKQAT